MGRIVVRDLFEFAETDDQIVIGDFDLLKAKALAKSFKDRRVRAAQIDVRKPRQTVRALRGAFALINCIQHDFNLLVMEAALRAQTHYIDLGGLFHMTKRQLPLDPKFREIGRLAILGMGAAPGITNLLARAGADQLDTVREIHCRVAGADQTRYKELPALPLSYSLRTIIEEFSLDPAVFSKDKLGFLSPLSGQIPMKFPRPVGVQLPMHTIHSEVATLPFSFSQKGVKEVSFKIAFDPIFLQKVKFLKDLGLTSRAPITIDGAKIAPLDLLSKVAAAQTPPTRIGKLRQHEVVRTIVKGTKNGRKLTLILDCYTQGNAKWNLGSDINTGCPPAIVARMIAAGEIVGSGVAAPEEIVPPTEFFRHLKRRGFRLTITKIPGWSLQT